MKTAVYTPDKELICVPCATAKVEEREALLNKLPTVEDVPPPLGWFPWSEIYPPEMAEMVAEVRIRAMETDIYSRLRGTQVG